MRKVETYRRPPLERFAPNQAPLQRIEVEAPGVTGWIVRAEETRNAYEVREWAISLICSNGNAVICGSEQSREARDRQIAYHVRHLRIYALGYDTEAERAAKPPQCYRDHHCKVCNLTERDGNLDAQGEALPRQAGKVCTYCRKASGARAEALQ